MTPFTESTIEQAAIDWLQELGYDYALDPEITFDGVVRVVVSPQDSLLPTLTRGEVRVR